MRPFRVPRRCVVFAPLALAAYALIRINRSAPGVPGWVASHGADLLVVPLVLCAVRMAAAARGRADRLPWYHGAAVALLFAVFFEWALPAVRLPAVADPLDAAAYLAGWIFFELALNRDG